MSSPRTLRQKFDGFFFARVQASPLRPFRLAVGLMAMVVLAANGVHWERYYAADGMRSADLFPDAVTQWWSVFHWGAGLIPIGAFWYIGFAGALLFTLGIQIRGAAFVCWLIFGAMVHRNSIATNAEDTILRMYFFYSLFMPWRNSARESVEVWPLRLVQIHLALIYFLSTMYKIALEPLWLQGDALYNVMIDRLWSAWPWPELFYFGLVAKAATWGSLLLEGGFGILVWFRPLRRWLVPLMIAFHLVIACTLRHVSLFSLTMIPGLLLFIERSDRQIIGVLTSGKDAD